MEEIKLKAIQISENPEQSEIIYENIRIIALDSFPINLHYTFETETETVFITCSFRQEKYRKLNKFIFFWFRRNQLNRHNFYQMERNIKCLIQVFGLPKITINFT